MDPSSRLLTKDAPALAVWMNAMGTCAGADEALDFAGARTDDPDPVSQHVGHQEAGAVESETASWGMAEAPGVKPPWAHPYSWPFRRSWLRVSSCR